MASPEFVTSPAVEALLRRRQGPWGEEDPSLLLQKPAPGAILPQLDARLRGMPSAPPPDALFTQKPQKGANVPAMDAMLESEPYPFHASYPSLTPLSPEKANLGTMLQEMSPPTQVFAQARKQNSAGGRMEPPPSLLQRMAPPPAATPPPPPELLAPPKPTGPGEHIMAIISGSGPRYTVYDIDPSRPNGGFINPFRTAAMNAWRTPLDAAMFQDIAQGQMFQAQEKLAPITPFINMASRGGSPDQVLDLMAAVQGGGVPPSMQGTALGGLAQRVPGVGQRMAMMLKGVDPSKQRPNMVIDQLLRAYGPKVFMDNVDVLGPALQQVYPQADFQNYIKQGIFEGAPTTDEGRLREALRGRFGM